MTQAQPSQNASLTVAYLGVIIGAVGMYLLPVWSPLFGIGIVLMWLGGLQSCIESVPVSKKQTSFRHFAMVALLLTLGLYPVVTAVLDYGHSLPQRLTIVIAAVALRSMILLLCKNSQFQSVASYQVAAPVPKKEV